ncbi:MAG: hypothetical protein NWR51_10780 [Akkermansiaceae bacterium]|nr:hypothetical protein [Akkermansiaceae bacterium]
MKKILCLICLFFLSFKAFCAESKDFTEKASVVFILTYLKGQKMPSKLESLALLVGEDEKYDAIMEVGYQRALPAAYDGQREIYMSYKEGANWFYFSLAESEKDFVVFPEGDGSKKIKFEDYLKCIKVIHENK